MHNAKRVVYSEEYNFKFSTIMNKGYSWIVICLSMMIKVQTKKEIVISNRCMFWAPTYVGKRFSSIVCFGPQYSINWHLPMSQAKTLDGFLEKKIIHNMNENANSSQCGCLSNRYQWLEPPPCFEDEFVWKPEGKWFCMKLCNLELMNEDQIPTLKVSTTKISWINLRTRTSIQFRLTHKMTEEDSRIRAYINVSNITLLQENKWRE